MTSNQNKRIVKNTLYLYLRMFLLVFVAFFTTREVLRILGIDDFGLYNVVAGFVAMVTFINQSITNSIQRFINFELGKDDSESLDNLLGVSMLTQVLICCILLLFSESIGLWFVNSKLKIPEGSEIAANVVYQTSVFSILLKILQSPFNALIIAKEKMQFYAIISLVEAFAQLGIVYLLQIVPAHKLEMYGLLLLLITICILFCNIIYCKRLMHSLKIRLYYNAEYFKILSSFCGWNLLGAGSGVIKSQGINILMNIFFGVSVNAARGISYQVLSGVSRFANNFQVAMYPQIIQSYAQGDRHRYFKLSYACSKLSLYLMWIIVLPLIVCVDIVLKIWLGNDIPKLSALFVQIILLTGLVDSLASAIATQIYATGDIKRYQIEVSAILLLILPISWILFKFNFPPESALWASLFISLVAQMSRVRIWCHLVKESPLVYVKRIIFPGISIVSLSLLLTTLLWTMCNQTILSFILITIFSVVLNIFLMYLIGFQKDEKKIITSFIKTKLNKNP